MNRAVQLAVLIERVARTSKDHGGFWFLGGARVGFAAASCAHAKLPQPGIECVSSSVQPAGPQPARHDAEANREAA